MMRLESLAGRSSNPPASQVSGGGGAEQRAARALARPLSATQNQSRTLTRLLKDTLVRKIAHSDRARNLLQQPDLVREPSRAELTWLVAPRRVLYFGGGRASGARARANEKRILHRRAPVECNGRLLGPPRGACSPAGDGRCGNDADDNKDTRPTTDISLSARARAKTDEIN